MPELSAIGYNPPDLVEPIFPLTDPMMTVHHKWLSRFYELPEKTYVVNDIIPNSVSGYKKGVVGYASTLQGGITSKGINIAGASYIGLPPEYFDIYNHRANDEAVVISIAVTPNDTQPALAGVIGKMRASGNAQWAIWYNADNLATRFPGETSHTIPPGNTADGFRQLLTLHFEAVGDDGKRMIHFYKGATLLASKAWIMASGYDQEPKLGSPGGFVSFTGKIHALHMLTPPAGFDLPGWLTAELAKLAADLD